MNEADILATTYNDSCVIERIKDVIIPETGITKQEYRPVYGDPIKCALSQSRLDGLPVIKDGEMLNTSVDDYQLFVRPTINIKKGDRITVTQQVNGLVIKLYAHKPFYYPSHCEVKLTGRDPNG